MKGITKEMLQIYKPYSNADWLNYKLIKSDVTFHHIQKRENGGKRIIENGALLMPVSHQYLHLIEYKNEEIYNILNKIFKLVNEQKHEPTTEQRRLVETILQEFEMMYEKDKNSKGKILIQKKYKNRMIF